MPAMMGVEAKSDLHPIRLLNPSYERRPYPMSNKYRGVMQSPVTPLKDDFSLDLATFEKVLDFHVRTGAPAISWPHHKGESLNLTIPERKRFAEATVKVVAGRVPVTI